MGKATRSKKTRPAPPAAAAHAWSTEAQEIRALLRRVPDGFQAGLNALAARPVEDRERVMTELARGMGREILPLLKSAALGKHEDLALSAVRVLPVLGTRAAGDVLVEVHGAAPDGERARLACVAAEALRARGVHVELPEPEHGRPEGRFSLRETYVTAPDGVGSRSVVARLQDEYGVWHACFVLWNDQAGVKDGFMRPFSRQEWQERVAMMEDRASAPVPCPPDYARWQVERGRRLNAETGFPLGDSLGAWDRVLGPLTDGYTPPDPLAEAPEDGDGAALPDSAGLFSHAAVRSWFLEADDCVESARRWMELQARLRIRGQSEELQAQITAAVVEAVDELLTPALLDRYTARLLDLARTSQWKGDVTTLARAAAVVRASGAGKKPSEIPFYQSMVERSLMVAADMLARGEDPKRSRYRPMRRYQA